MSAFDHVADSYDATRPGYPDALWRELERACGLGPGTKVLEIGCGSGQATRELLARGAQVHAIEPGVQLAERARRNLAGSPGLRIEQARFEDVAVAPASVDLVVAATSFHWIDPSIAFTKSAEWLRSRGSLALLTNIHIDTGTHARADFTVAMSRLHAQLAGGLGDWQFPSGADVERRAHAPGSIAEVWARVERAMLSEPQSSRAHGSNLFEVPQVVTQQRVCAYSADRFVQLLSSQSAYAALQPELRHELLAGVRELVTTYLGDEVTKGYLTVLAHARKR